VTIALGIIARDGIVIAADREEGDGYLKTDRGKILQVFRGRNPVGWIAISGAGNGPALDEVARLLGDTFCEEEESTAGQAKDALTKVHRSYYEKTVLPFAPTERPDYELVKLAAYAAGSENHFS
jgi:20S proteasome alpha/beta subunit